MKTFLARSFNVQERQRSSFSSDHGFRDYYICERWRVTQNYMLGGICSGFAMGCVFMWAVTEGVAS